MSTLNVDNLPNQELRMATAWVNFNMATGSINGNSFNVSSITDLFTGVYAVNFATPMDNTDYSLLVSASSWNGVTNAGISTYENGDRLNTTFVELVAASTSDQTGWDSASYSMVCFGGKA